MKKVIALLLSVLMLVGMVPLSVAFAQSSADVTFTVEANKTQVNAGDEVVFSVYMDTDIPFTGIQADIAVPEGMTYVANSGSVPSFWTSELGFAEASFTELTKRITIAHYLPYTATEKLKVMEFKCIATEGSVNSLEVSITGIDVTDSDFDSLTTAVVPANVKVSVPVTGVTLDKDTLALDTGDNKTATLTATVDPNKATDKTVTWKSSDETVATVNNGVVTAIKHGTTTITVTTVDGGFTDVCVVTVTCAHTAKTPTNAKTANCQEGGWDAYYTCDACGQLFAADGTTKINAIPTTAKDVNNHTNIQPFAADTATCTHKGHDAYEKCVDCGVVTSGSDAKYFGEHNYGELKTAVSEKHTPDTLTPAVAAHYQCSVCLKYFTEAKIETTLAALTGTTPSHSYGNWVNTDDNQHWKACACGDKIEVGDHKYDNTCDTICNTCGHVRTIAHTWSTTWSTDGTNHWKDCTVCHNARNEEGTHTGGTATCQAHKECTVCHSAYGDLNGCDYVENPAANYLVSDATCVSKAVYKKSCSVCGAAHASETFETGSKDATNHVGGTEVKDAAPATCTVPGYTGDTYCKGCTVKIATGTAIPAEHKLNKITANPATHEAAGNIEHYACAVCEKLYNDNKATKELTEAEVVISKGEHSYSEAFKSDENGHWKECECGSKIEEGAHTFGEWTVTKESTTTEKGSKEKVCSVCGYTITEDLPLAENKDPNIPETGDHSQFGLWLVLMLISACGMITLLFVTTQKKGKYQR